MTDVQEPYAGPPAPVLDGHGISLRVWDPESAVDVDAWLRGHVDPEFLRWNTPLRDITDTAGARESLRARAAAMAAGTAVTFCVTDAADGTILGQIGLNAVDHVQSSAGVGYWVLPEARGRGVAARSLRLATNWFFTEIGLHRLKLGHAVGHDASCRIAERCGFRYEGTQRGAMWEAGRRDAWRDVHCHARLATDPDPAGPG
ncbi:GNAT family N-acetyltransferase [Streptomyces phaeoluteigriseus]|uniref:GNAT family N-acetyltransferase n=1 Tax=Streptomyces phaeoluteigriseus TaxID=114686 RepID=A0A1V6MTY0_9ACTN|nr:GNAT family protein [Streptomyces phaeoluteigriseus]OQD55812.1 GNAT family N-acetyltransferase [Streptomyces phaeoluteigriseus]